MKIIEVTLREERNRLQEIKNAAEKRMVCAPKGRLRISKKKSQVEYYYKSENGEIKSKNGRYLKKEERQLAKDIAQRDYDACVIKCTTEKINLIETFLERYKKNCLNEIYEKLNSYRKELIDTCVISDEEFIKQWQSLPYEGKAFADDAQVIVTERGERVRSKSEKIIADKLYLMKIPYRYEYPIKLKGNITIYPDFTILKMPERKEVYLEHFGMMDNPDYISTTLQKIDTYADNGIYIGGQLFITYETGKKTINTKALGKMFQELFDSDKKDLN